MKPLTNITVINNVKKMKITNKMLLQVNSPPFERIKITNKHLTIKSSIIMKTIKLLLTVTLLFTINSYGQLDKKTWLVGGSGSFDSYKQEQSFISQGTGEPINVVYNHSNIKLSANVGYFIYDKFVTGLKLTYTDLHGKSVEDDTAFSLREISGGPFLRYYFLKKDKHFNLLSEINYQFGTVGNGRGVQKGNEGKINTISLLIGPEFYFNSSVGMEVLLGYRNYNRNMSDSFNTSITENGFQVAIGFQIHLEKR